MNDADAFSNLEPAGLWQHFAAITRIPRPSGREGAMADYVRAWAAERGWAVKGDAAGNVCVHVPGNAGRMEAPVTILQSHLDMVCERDSDSPYDTERGEIHAVREGDWIHAEGTTLGADNGIGVAAMMHAAEMSDAARGPLDLLFTVEEETGLTGALKLDPSILRGRVLLNLDSEDEGELTVGCAGSSEATVTLRTERTPVGMGWTTLRVHVCGLLGGHSGVDIIKPRLNAIRALARLLARAADAASSAGAPSAVRVAELRGGNKRNAIPREASATVWIPAADEPRVREAIAAETATLRGQFGDVETGLEIKIDVALPAGSAAWDAATSRRLFDLILAIPCGVLVMSPAVVGLVETSNSLGTAEWKDGAAHLGCMCRSSRTPAMGDVLGTIAAAARLAGAEIEGAAGYPGWQPNPGSALVQVVQRTHERIFGHAAKVVAVHAGLECGAFLERAPGLDMVSFGPDIRGPHAPGERVHVGSVGRFFGLLMGVLEDLSSKGGIG